MRNDPLKKALELLLRPSFGKAAAQAADALHQPPAPPLPDDVRALAERLRGVDRNHWIARPHGVEPITGEDMHRSADRLEAQAHEIARLRALVRDRTRELNEAWERGDRLEADRDRLKALLLGLIDHEPCRTDHHGYCQTHGQVTTVCQVAEARAALAGGQP